jgi:hypothetical protein
MDEPKLDHWFTIRISEEEKKQLAGLRHETRTKLNIAIRLIIDRVLQRPQCPHCGAKVGECLPHKSADTSVTDAPQHVLD